MASYLLVIGDREVLGWILAESRTAFPSANRADVAAFAQGDELFLYTTRSCFKNPTRDRGRVIGTATVTSNIAHLDAPIQFGGRSFPVGCTLSIGPLAAFGEGPELQPLVTHMEEFGHTAHAWSILLRRPMLQISDDDARLLRDRLAGSVMADSAEAYTRWWAPAEVSKA